MLTVFQMSGTSTIACAARAVDEGILTLAAQLCVNAFILLIAHQAALHLCSKLSTYLPHKVDEVRSRAEWDSRTHKLKITMRIVREDR